jgi:hypothetical protein
VQRTPAAKAQKGPRHREALGGCERVGGAPAERDPLGPGGARRNGEQRRTVIHHGLVGLMGPVPFQQGEFGMVQRAALAVAKHTGELEDPALAGGEQFLGGEFG